MNIAESSFLITGGASGLGAATARHLVEKRGRVVIGDVNEQAGALLADELGEKAEFARLDVICPEDVSRAVALCQRDGNVLRGVVNCAGILHAARVVGREGPYPLEEFARVVQVNLVGTFNVMRLAAEAIAENSPDSEGERGAIVNTASVAAFDGQIGQASYSASKGGVAAMTLPIARELSKHGIRVVAIAPGVFETPMMAALSAEAREALEAQVPFPSRLGRPEEYGRLAVHIFENQMLNGSVIRLDGALRMPAK